MKIIHQNEFVVQMWKNGNGTTRELARDSDSGMNLWRLSLAEMEETAQFSEFPGQRRALTVVGGKGLKLTFQDRVERVLPNCPTVFDGDDSCVGEPLDVPIDNLNLIYDPTAVRVAVQCIGPNTVLSLPTGYVQHFVFVTDGTVGVGSALLSRFDLGILERLEGSIEANSGSAAVLISLKKQKDHHASVAMSSS